MLPDLSLLPGWYLIVVSLGFGLIVGSFLNVFIYRFHTGKSLNGRSHCLSCGTPLRWYELVPVFSYLVLRGRCRTCGCRIPSRYMLVELATALLFVATLLLTLRIEFILWWWFVFAVLVVITVYDLYHFIIPDRLTLTLIFALFVMFAYRIFLDQITLEYVGLAAAAALGATAFFFFLWSVSKGRWIGFGDVKLAFPLGLLVGPSYVFSFVVVSFWVGAAISILILLWQKFSGGKASLHAPGQALTMKSAVPFAPFLVAGCLIILFTHFDVLALFSFA